MQETNETAFSPEELPNIGRKVGPIHQRECLEEGNSEEYVILILRFQLRDRVGLDE